MSSRPIDSNAILHFSAQVASVLNELSHMLIYGFYGDCASLLLGDRISSSDFKVKNVVAPVDIKGKSVPGRPQRVQVHGGRVEAYVVACHLQLRKCRDFDIQVLSEGLDRVFPDGVWLHTTRINTKDGVVEPLSSFCLLDDYRIGVTWECESSSPDFQQVFYDCVSISIFSIGPLYRKRVTSLAQASAARPTEAARLLFLYKMLSEPFKTGEANDDLPNYLHQFAAALREKKEQMAAATVLSLVEEKPTRSITNLLSRVWSPLLRSQ